MDQFRQRGGASWVTRSGLVLQCTWPFASLEVGEDGLDLRVFLKRRRVKKADVVRIKQVTWLTDGMHFCTTNPGEHFTFWTFNPSALQHNLEERGWEVASSEGSPDCVGA